jgi:hypothetical protein
VQVQLADVWLDELAELRLVAGERAAEQLSLAARGGR